MIVRESYVLNLADLGSQSPRVSFPHIPFGPSIEKKVVLLGALCGNL